MTGRAFSGTDGSSQHRADGRDHALVMGGSMAGLLAARVLADHFHQVTIVERDHLSQGTAFRAGVPQSRHVHALLARGAELLESLFPGLEAEVCAAGAHRLQWPRDVMWLLPAGWCRRFDSGIKVLSCSRGLLEWSVRRRLAGFDNVRILDACEVTGLVPGPDRSAVAGVQLRPRRGGSGAAAPAATLGVSLVVDASGRQSPAPRWLEALGYTAPRETRIDALAGYASPDYSPGE
jgi:2-polyprenyl-6-methoxyphenol hydroxylase-like FAD-dependent oxidoreductase